MVVGRSSLWVCFTWPCLSMAWLFESFFTGSWETPSKGMTFGAGEGSFCSSQSCLLCSSRLFPSLASSLNFTWMKLNESTRSESPFPSPQWDSLSFITFQDSPRLSLSWKVDHLRAATFRFKRLRPQRRNWLPVLPWKGCKAPVDVCLTVFILLWKMRMFISLL